MGQNLSLSGERVSLVGDAAMLETLLNNLLNNAHKYTPVGGEILFNAVKSLRYGASLAACGLVDSPEIPATVLPFLLRHVNLLGIDSVQLPLAQKAEIWKKLAGPWRLEGIERGGADPDGDGFLSWNTKTYSCAVAYAERLHNVSKAEIAPVLASGKIISIAFSRTRPPSSHRRICTS